MIDFLVVMQCIINFLFFYWDFEKRLADIRQHIMETLAYCLIESYSTDCEQHASNINYYF